MGQYLPILSRQPPENIVLKGIFLGVTMWLLFIGWGNYFRMPVFSNMPTMAALMTWINSAVYGLMMSFTLNIIHK